jgi:hypothetical protein
MFKTNRWIDFAAALLPGAGIIVLYGGLYVTVIAVLLGGPA